MVWLRFGVGSLGMACLGLAAMTVLGQGGIPFGENAQTVLLSFAAVGLSLTLAAMIQTAVSDAPMRASDEGMGDNLRHAPGEPDESNAGNAHVRLIPSLQKSERTPGKSWLGGCPKLPKDTSWPLIEGQPGQFLAQIDCAALPPRLWKGAGPRHGAMVFFRAARPQGGALPVRVMHVDGQLSSRTSPDDQETRPCWPLLIRHDDQVERPEEGKACAEPNWSVLHDVDLTSPGYQPFDWTSAEMLLGCLEAQIETCAGKLGPEGTQEENGQLAQTRAGLAELRAALATARVDQDFNSVVRKSLKAGLAALALPEPLTRDDASTHKTLPLLQHRSAAQAYFAPFERHCRQIYSQSPDQLPFVQRALFEPFWAHNARHETGSIGVENLRSFTETDAETGAGAPELLLELPSSELLGWMFGEGRSLRIYAAPDDLEQGKFDRAWGSVVA